MAAREKYTKQERAWGTLYDRIQSILRPIAVEEFRGRADYWLLDDNWGPTQHKLYVNNLKLLAPEIIKQLQNCLKGHPDWEIVVAVAVPGAGKSWPNMGLFIRPHEIVEDLQRQYFPPEFQHIQYVGSRRGSTAERED